MKWFKQLPQKEGEFLWCEPDMHCWIIGLVTVCRLANYRLQDIPSLGSWEPGRNGGSMRYKWEDGTEAVMCFKLAAPCRKPETNEPSVSGWTEFNGPRN